MENNQLSLEHDKSYLSLAIETVLFQRVRHADSHVAAAEDKQRVTREMAEHIWKLAVEFKGITEEISGSTKERMNA